NSLIIVVSIPLLSFFCYDSASYHDLHSFPTRRSSDLYSTITYDDYLEHYGVKGMKWGVRREEGPDGLVGKNNSSKEPTGDSNKSKRRVHLEAKYISKGDDQATAEIKADRRIK